MYRWYLYHATLNMQVPNWIESVDLALTEVSNPCPTTQLSMV